MLGPHYMLPRVPSLIWGFSGKKLRAKCPKLGIKTAARNKGRWGIGQKSGDQGAKCVAPFKSFPLWPLTLPAVWGWQAQVSSSFAPHHSDWVVQLTPSALGRLASILSSALSTLVRVASILSSAPLFLSACAHAAHPPAGPFLHWDQHYPSVSVLSSVKVEPLHLMMASLFSELS